MDVQKTPTLNGPASDVTGSPSRPSDVTGSPSRPSDVTGSPSRPSDVTGSPSRPSDVTGSPSRPSDVTGSPSRPQKSGLNTLRNKVKRYLENRFEKEPNQSISLHSKPFDNQVNGRTSSRFCLHKEGTSWREGRLYKKHTKMLFDGTPVKRLVLDITQNDKVENGLLMTTLLSRRQNSRLVRVSDAVLVLGASRQ